MVGWTIIGTYITYKYQSAVLWTNIMSLYAIIISHWAGMQSARTEEKIDDNGQS